jgi:hypothetical protein
MLFQQRQLAGDANDLGGGRAARAKPAAPSASN